MNAIETHSQVPYRKTSKIIQPSYSLRTIKTEELTSFLKNKRYWMTQDSLYVLAKQKMHERLKIYGLFDQENILQGTCVVALYRLKKFFLEANIQYGPILASEQNQDLFMHFVKLLERELKKDRKILRLIFSPFVFTAKYQDITKLSTFEEAEKCKYFLEKNGYQKLKGTYMSHKKVALQYFYVKNMKDMDEQQFLSSLSAPSRSNFKKAEKLHFKTEKITEKDLPRFLKIYNETSMQKFSRGSIPAYLLQQYTSIAEHYSFYITTLLLVPSLEKLRIKEKQLLSKAEKLSYMQGVNTTSFLETQRELTSLQETIKELEKLFIEKGECVDMACAVFFDCGKDFIYGFAGSYGAYNKFRPVYALHLHCIRKALKLHKEYYNLFGISGDFSTEAPDYGTMEFKRRFKGEVQETLGTFYKPLNFFGKFFPPQ